ncbi:peptidyl-prolyl cis-trans isomerase [Puccinia sorghi]|uniref:peptidylprolyl isomerase n=1 Tax=Puccinia sorghi TaxID=27349 RepID=A0A0L6UZ65_9BASI|nr:peptidyl-prolyl cis-trans isomerase [Puccinia sorghi]
MECSGDDIPPDAPLTFHVELIKIQNRRYDARPVKKLGIETTHKPPTCAIKSKKGDRLAMIYVGTLKSDGLQFDAIKTPDTPFEFNLGAGEVIQGWEEGLEDMCIGERRRLVIPASMGYGHSGNYGSDPPIPADADLVFDTALLDIRNKAAHNKPMISKRPDDDDQGRWLWGWTVLESLGYILECILVFF